jgi:hypothetical protein
MKSKFFSDFLWSIAAIHILLTSLKMTFWTISTKFQRNSTADGEWSDITRGCGVGSIVYVPY